MKSKHTIGWRFFQRKQFSLFLLAVVLPCAVLVALTWHVIDQEQELREKRMAEEQRLIVRDISHELLAHVEEVKLREIGAQIRRRSLNTLDYASEHTVFTGLATGGRLLLPWEIQPAPSRLDQAAGESPFSQKIRQAEQLEFVDGDFAQAGTIYRECVAQAQRPEQQAYARLLLAGVLAKGGSPSDSLAEFQKVVTISPEVVDEHGVPFCLYAARHLVERGDRIDGVMGAIDGVLHAGRWLLPAESFMLRDTIEALEAQMPDSGKQRGRIEEYRHRILTHLHRQAEALAVQQSFPRLSLGSEWNNGGDELTPLWVPYGSEPLLISLAPVGPDGSQLAIAVNGRSVLHAMSAKHSSARAPLTDLRLTSSSTPAAQPLGPSFPGLNIVYTRHQNDAFAGHWSLRGSFYLSTLVVVLCVVGFGAYSFWRDVTRELRMGEMRSQFIASVSHELKTPLTAIRMYAETLRLGRLKREPQRTEYLDTIINESHRLTRLLNNVLDFSKIEKGKRAYSKEPVRLPEIVRAAADAMQYPLAQQQFQLAVTLEDDLPEITVDTDAIEQALLNLISNAMKYSGESREITLRAAKLDDQVLIEVGDRGIGIEPAEQQRIFEKFYRVSDAETLRVPGTGLGLALVSHIVRAHNGRIEVRSQPGRGSTFSIYIPLEMSHEPNPGH